jgi:hypothetical protein
MIPELPDEIAELLDDASPADDAASDADVAAFIAEHKQRSRAQILAGLTSALRKRIGAGESRHQSTVTVSAGAMKEARLGLYPAQTAIDALKLIFVEAVAKQPTSDKQGAARNGAIAQSEWNGILAWAVGQALGADLDEVRARINEKMPDGTTDTNVGTSESAGDDDETVPTVAWPTLNGAALRGTAGQIITLVAPHTEADSVAILVQLLAVFGATLGSGPHFMAGNERHQAIINPLIIGRTNDGAKGTSLGVVEAIRKRALPWFEEFTTSGLSTAEGLIELVRDPSGDPDDEKGYDPGIADKRLLVKESEYRSVLTRCRREGNTLGEGRNVPVQDGLVPALQGDRPPGVNAPGRSMRHRQHHRNIGPEGAGKGRPTGRMPAGQTHNQPVLLGRVHLLGATGRRLRAVGGAARPSG